MGGNVDNPCSHSVGFAEIIWRRLFPVINTVLSIPGKAGERESSQQKPKNKLRRIYDGIWERYRQRL